MSTTGTTIKAAFLARDGCPFVGKIFDEPRRKRIACSAELNPVVLTPGNFAENRAAAAETEVLFTCWGLPSELLTVENFPALKAVFFSGGSVKFFAKPLLERGVQVVGARVPNAIAVTHFCLAQIILSCKGFFRNTRECRNPAKMLARGCFAGPGLYGETIALIGMGTVARELVPLLHQVDLKVIAMDPYLTEEEAARLHVGKVTTEEAFARAYVVSNHLPNLPELEGMMNRKLFASMRPNATFINTGRGAEVNEADLAAVMRERPDLTALLDVTEPEPPLADSPLHGLENVQLSSHIAGAIHDEVWRQGDFVLNEFDYYVAGKPLPHGDSLETWDRMA